LGKDKRKVGDGVFEGGGTTHLVTLEGQDQAHRGSVPDNGQGKANDLRLKPTEKGNSSELEKSDRKWGKGEWQQRTTEKGNRFGGNVGVRNGSLKEEKLSQKRR